MTTEFDFTESYSSSPTVTTLITVTGSGSADNALLHIYAISDDASNPYGIDQTFTMHWNGSTFDLITPTPLLTNYSWSVSTDTASFNLTPTLLASGGNVSGHVIFIQNNSTFSVNS